MRNPRSVFLIVAIALAILTILVLPGIISGIVSAVIVSRAVNSQTEELARLIQTQGALPASSALSPEESSERTLGGAPETSASPDGGSLPPSASSTDAVISAPRAVATVDLFAKVAGTPVAMAFAPDGRIFYSELKTGEIRILDRSGASQGTFATLPVNPDGDEQGLLGLAIDPDFESNGYLYAYYSYQFGGQSFNRLVRLREVPDFEPEIETILDSIPGSNLHNGGSIVLDGHRRLYVSVGEAGTSSDAQRTDNLKGKVLRLNMDGSAAEGNPMTGNPVFAWGFRNPFGMTMDSDSGTLYATDNGPDCCDELNIVQSSMNYGWPLIRGYSEEGTFENPVYVWEPRTVAPTIPEFYNGDNYGPDFSNVLLVGTFNTAQLFLFNREFLSNLRSDDHDPQVITRLTSPIIGVFESPDGVLYLTARGAIYMVTSLDTAFVSSIDFRDGHNGERLRTGWNGHEMGGRSSAFRWTTGRAEANLPPISAVGDGWLRIVGSARLDVHEGEAISIGVTLNEASLGEVEINEEGEFRISLPVDGNILTENIAALVALEVSPTFVPAEEVPGSADRRELGVKVNSISLVVP